MKQKLFITMLFICSCLFAQTDSSYNKCLASLQLIQSGMISKMKMMQSYAAGCDEIMIKEDIGIFSNKYLPAINSTIDSCNKIDYSKHLFAATDEQQILTWVNAVKLQYGYCLGQIQVNATYLQQRRQNENVNNMLAGLFKLALSTYLPGVK